MRGGALLARAHRMVRKHSKEETGLDPDDELPTPGSPGCRGLPAPPPSGQPVPRVPGAQTATSL